MNSDKRLQITLCSKKYEAHFNFLKIEGKDRKRTFLIVYLSSPLNNMVKTLITSKNLTFDTRINENIKTHR